MNLNHTTTANSSSTSQEATTVFVVDGDDSACDVLESLIRSAGWHPTISRTAEEFLCRPRAMSPGCLISDANLPGLGGLELQKRIADRTELPIIFVSDRIDIRTTVEAMKRGAFEFLTKPFVRDLLLQAIEQAIARSHVVLQSLACSRALQERYHSLSRREREVMTLVVSGRLNKQVGGELGISEITVKAHRGKLMRKMRARSFAELVNMATSLRRDSLPASPWFDVPRELAGATYGLGDPRMTARLT
jgi:FixJ family two-component response regulator